MRKTLAALFLAVVLTFCGASRAQAQGYHAPNTLSVGYASQPWSVYSAPPSSRVYTYSYYAAAPGSPARVYVGPPQFPFYGKPYGHPNDRWSWQAMSDNGYGTLARYYYPPLN